MMFQFKKALLAIVFIVIILASMSLYGPSGETGIAPAKRVAGSSRLSELLGNNAADEYPKVLAPREFHFPADHGPHPEFRNEWWYVTGNLDSDDGDRFGYELTLFRFALAPQQELPEDSASAWKTRQVYIGHFAVSDVNSGKFHVAQRYSRGAAGLAGAQAMPFRVWIDDWTMEESQDRPETWRLYARENEIEIELVLDAQKKPVLNGKDGLSKKSDALGNASYYYSLTRLQTDGVIHIGNKQHTVSGLSWLDREWGSSALSSDQIGWDWFALQLSDGSDLMYYNLRRNDGTQDSNSAGTFTDAAEHSTYLGHDEVAIDVRNFWESEQGGRYPSAWSINIPEQGLQLEVTPVIDNQELNTTVRYWEGAVDVRGYSADVEITGRGYVELTGYAE